MKKNLVFIIFFIFVNLSFAKEKTLTFAFDPYPPYHEKRDGKTTGIFIDIIKELFEKRLNYTLKFQQFPWKRAQSEVEHGTADFMITVPTKMRLDYSHSIPTTMTILGAYIYTYVGHPRLLEISKIQTVKDLKKTKLTGITVLGTKWFEVNIEPNLKKTHYAYDDTSSIKMLAAKRADIIVVTEGNGDTIIKKLKFQSKVIKTTVNLEPWPFHILFSKKTANPTLLKQINLTLIKMIEEGFIEKIKEKHKIE